jgi:transcriptional regulator with XRE-family HTH domain
LTKWVNSSYSQEMATELSKLLRGLREERGESLRAAAGRLDVDPSYLSRLERGKKPPSAQFLARAATLYSIPEEMLALAEGSLPPDIVRIVQVHPELIDELRTRYDSE